MTHKAHPKHHHHADPCNVFHEMRRYLICLGLETRIGTLDNIPLPQDMLTKMNISANTERFTTLDNFFLFELRRIFQTDTRYVNTVAFLFRVFFKDDQDGTAFHVQVVCNHLGHGTLDMNQAYNEVVDNLIQSEWNKVPHSYDIFSLEKEFKSLKQFKAEFAPLYAILQKHDVLNNHQLSNEMQG